MLLIYLRMYLSQIRGKLSWFLVAIPITVQKLSKLPKFHQGTILKKKKKN